MSEWVSVKDRMPRDCTGVLVFGFNECSNSRTAKAMYARKFELEANEEAIDCDCAEYNEALDEYYVSEGWYEDNTVAEINYRLDFVVTHWMPLPPPPKPQNH